MSKKMLILPNLQSILEQTGHRIKLARLRRRFSASLIAERAGIDRTTLWKIEKGDASVAFGYYAKVLHALGLADDLLLIAKDDELGRFLQDCELKGGN